MKTKRNTVWISALLVAFTRSLALAAAGDENWDSTFGVPGANDEVGAITAKDKDVYFGGLFSAIGGMNANHIARWDGTRWHPLGSGLNGSVSALATGGNRLYVAGFFTRAGAGAAIHIARWDGSNWSALGDGISGSVSALAVVGDELFAGGSFTSAGGLGIPNIARWDGTNWSPVGGGINGPVTALAALSGSLFAGGSFTQAGSANATNFARWDGTNWLAMEDGLPVPPSAMAASASAVYTCVRTGMGWDTISTISKWDTSKRVEAFGLQFEPFCFEDFYTGFCDPRIECMAVNGTDLYLAGLFYADWRRDCWGIAKFDGSVRGLGSGIIPSENVAYALAATGSELYLGGRFRGAVATSCENIALWHVPHALSATRAADALTLSWPATGTNFVLEAESDLTGSQWAEVAQKPVVVGDQLVVTNALGPTSQFFRLRRP
jgi:trimeric autotransporter adhesin